MTEIKRHPRILKRENSALLIIDIQEKLFKVMRQKEKLLKNVLKLIKGIRILNIPIYYTEQYPKGLGHTVSEIQDELQQRAIEKLTFSCSGADDLFSKLKQNQIEQIIVCGIETHVCVQQTVLDLIANDFQVNLPVNATSSRFKIDYKTSLNLMQKNGCEITTVEPILFEFLEICGTSEFKSISSLIKLK